MKSGGNELSLQWHGECNNISFLVEPQTNVQKDLLVDLSFSKAFLAGLLAESMYITSHGSFVVYDSFGQALWQGWRGGEVTGARILKVLLPKFS